MINILSIQKIEELVIELLSLRQVLSILEYNNKDCIFFEKFIVLTNVLYSEYIILLSEFLLNEQCINIRDKYIHFFNGIALISFEIK